MNVNQVYEKYLKRASKDHSNKKTMDKNMFRELWNVSDVFREEIIKYIKETEEF